MAREEMTTGKRKAEEASRPDAATRVASPCSAGAALRCPCLFLQSRGLLALAQGGPFLGKLLTLDTCQARTAPLAQASPLGLSPGTSSRVQSQVHAASPAASHSGAGGLDAGHGSNPMRASRGAAGGVGAAPRPSATPLSTPQSTAVDAQVCQIIICRPGMLLRSSREVCQVIICRPGMLLRSSRLPLQ